MDRFRLGNDFWQVKIVDPNNPVLIDRSERQTVATTDPTSHTVNLSADLSGNFLIRVLIHELGHCAMISFGLLDDIHRLVPKENWVEVEEWVCNFIADYGERIYKTACKVCGFEAWKYIPNELNKWQQLRR